MAGVIGANIVVVASGCYALANTGVAGVGSGAEVVVAAGTAIGCGLVNALEVGASICCASIIVVALLNGQARRAAVLDRRKLANARVGVAHVQRASIVVITRGCRSTALARGAGITNCAQKAVIASGCVGNVGVDAVAGDLVATICCASVIVVADLRRWSGALAGGANVAAGAGVAVVAGRCRQLGVDALAGGAGIAGAGVVIVAILDRCTVSAAAGNGRSRALAGGRVAGVGGAGVAIVAQNCAGPGALARLA